MVEDRLIRNTTLWTNQWIHHLSILCTQSFYTDILHHNSSVLGGAYRLEI